MSIHYWYDSTDLADVPGTIVKGSINSLGTNADGTFDTGEIEVLDPGGTLAFKQLKPWLVTETDDTLNPRSFTGMIFNAKVNRGPYVRGAGRRWVLTVADINYLLKLRILKGATAVRPKETGSARVAWLLTSIALAGLVFDNGEIATNSWEFDKTDYRGKYATDVLAEIVGAAAEDDRWTFSVYWDPVALQPSLLFGGVSRTTHDCTIGLSNVPGEADNVTVFDLASDPTPELDTAGEDIYDAVLVKYQGGYAYRRRIATYTEFGIHRDGFYEDDRITTLEQANAQGDLWLERHAGKIDTVTCTVRLPTTLVNHVEAAMRIQVRFQQLPGWTDPIWVRIQKRSFQMAVDKTRKLFYYVNLTLSNRGWLSNGGSSGSGFPHHPPSDVSYVQEKGANTHTVVLDNAPTDGHLLTWFVTSRNVNITATTPTGWTMLDYTYDGTGISSRYAAVYYKIALGDISTFQWLGSPAGFAMHVFEWADGVTIDTAAGSFGDIRGASAPGDLSAVSVTPTEIATLVGNLLVGSNDINPIDVVPGAGTTQIYYSTATGFSPRNWVGIKPAQSGASSVAAALTGTNGYGGITYAVYNGDAANTPPDQGQSVIGEIVTMNGASGTTAHPFADGSLHVFVDHLDQTAALIYQDGECGDFTLAFTPKAGELVTVEYQGR